MDEAEKLPADDPVGIELSPGPGSFRQHPQDFGVSPPITVGSAIDTSITFVGAAGGLTGVAATLKAFFYRHRHKKITVTTTDREVVVQGFSKSDSERIIDQALNPPNKPE